MKEEDFKVKYLDGQQHLKGEFQGSDYKREETLTRCERYAGWTLPNIFPDDPLNEYDEMQNDYQSVGAQSVTNLANKIMMALFQPTRPFFRIKLSAEQKESIMESGLEEAEIESTLAAAERAAMDELDKRGARVVLTLCILQLIITGNSLAFMPRQGKLQNYSLRDYTLERDLRGEMTKLIVRETKAVTGLPDDLAQKCMEEGYAESDEVSLYTGVVKVGPNKYIQWQELEDLAYCHQQIGIYNKDTLPWIPLTWNLCRDKNYGTGLVENYAGDFHTLSTLAEAILDYTTVVTDVKNLVDPAGMTDVREITEAPTGAYVHGREEDLFVHSPNVSQAADFLTNQFNTVERRIGAAFLVNTMVTRDAERVTAQEIRMQAQELEGSLGGVYSRLAADLQAPLAIRLLSAIDPIFRDVEPTIVTGLESLSRNSDLDQLRYFFQDLIALADVPDKVSERIDYKNLIATLGAGHGVDYQKFLKDDDQVKRDTQNSIKENAELAGREAQAVNAAQG